MKSKSRIAVILAAGLGTRMRSSTPKVLHPLGGHPMLLHVLKTLENVGFDKTALVVGPDMEDVIEVASDYQPDIKIIVQEERLGTGHAVMASESFFNNNEGTIIVVYGDTPLLTSESIQNLVEAREVSSDPAAVVIGFRESNDNMYGRLVLDTGGSLLKIVEHQDASQEELAITLCNSGIFAFDSKALPLMLKKLSNENAKQEYYLTDIVEVAIREGRQCAFIEGVLEELVGINSRMDLSNAETIFQKRQRELAMRNGATLLDPSTVYFSWDTLLGQDVVVGPNVVFGLNVTIGDNVTIHAFSHLEGAKVEPGSVIGPFARLRPGTKIGKNANIGNFVEIKNSVILDGAKANHLTYVGDAKVGRNANLGAGTITCNFDGKNKSSTVISDGAFIGSNTALVAPVKIGKNSVIGAGSVITKDVSDGSLGISRAQQTEVTGWLKSRSKPKSKN